jgi:hypothetical protein
MSKTEVADQGFQDEEENGGSGDGLVIPALGQHIATLAPVQLVIDAMHWVCIV